MVIMVKYIFKVPLRGLQRFINLFLNSLNCHYHAAHYAWHHCC
ncbi:hypothetical protein BTN50_2090 [Candidatus Enterovibrio altilux]|uniref:Uncharacterized protein n=1 Tax=Candidatus Enterovibrio altilux TaxID=1927128 RepID=A0A291BBV1_9GAMM|nr:hypothetical protein BTN50_2090 [Candidatus Enterovibrio luxaltus]